MLRFLFRFMVCMLGLLVLWAAGYVWFVRQIPTSTTRISGSYDAVIVLTGGAGRIDQGLQRVREGYARQIFISGVNDEATPEHIIQQAIKREEAASNLQEGELSLGYHATSTIGNADEVREWIVAHQIRSILLVTANYHMPRSLLEFRFVMPENLQITPDAVLPEGFDVSQWWRMGNSSRIIMNEYHKWLAATLRHMLILWHKS